MMNFRHLVVQSKILVLSATKLLINDAMDCD